jgi:hypothetical protein
MSAVSISFQAHSGMDWEKSAISLSLRFATPTQRLARNRFGQELSPTQLSTFSIVTLASLWHCAEMPKPRLIFIIDKDFGMGTCSACAAIFRVAGASKSVKHKLQKKFAKHASENHPGEEFSQAVMVREVSRRPDP